MMKKKKVIEFIVCLNDGGAETLVKDYALLIDKNVFEIVIVVLFELKQTANYKILSENGVRIVPIIRDNKTDQLLNKLFRKFFVCYKLIKIIERERPTVIHAHLSVLHYLSCISVFIRKIKLFYTCHSLPSLHLAGDHNREGEAARRLIKHNGLVLIGLHRSMVEELNSMFDVDNSVLIRNGINIDRFSEVGKTKRQIRKELGIDNNAFVIGHVGRFESPKNHVFLIKIFKRICEDKSNAVLLLVGDGTLKHEIIEMITDLRLNEHVVMLSNRTDIPELMKAMDRFVFPSQFEGLGIALIEAQASGLHCVVSTNIPKEAIVSNKVITLSLSESIDIWSEAIIDSQRYTKPYCELSEYNMKNVVTKLENMYLH